MINWLNTVLSAVSWWVKLIIIVISSLLSTLLPLPPPFTLADIAFLGSIGHINSIWWIAGLVLFIAAFDTAFAVVTYLLSHKLSRAIVRNEKKRQKLDELLLKLEKQAPLWLFIAGATPFPFTLTIYAAATLKYDLKKFTIIIAASRLTKYIVVATLYYLGYRLGL